MQAQFAPVYALHPGDFNNDGHLDLLLGGNTDDPDVLTGRYDAFKGLVLAGHGQGQFTPLSMRQSGVHVNGAVKSIVTVKAAVGGTLVVLAQNNDRVRVLKKNERRDLLVAK
jgi:hypothetical protein